MKNDCRVQECNRRPATRLVQMSGGFDKEDGAVEEMQTLGDKLRAKGHMGRGGEVGRTNTSFVLVPLQLCVAQGW